MPFTAAAIASQASQTLLDPTFARWPLPELNDYLNEALREIVARKPNANTKVVTLALVAGASQSLATTYTMLCRVVRNAVSNTAITALDDTTLMDLQIPGWRDPAVIPPHVDVVHVIPDITDHRRFYVVPPNNGSGQIVVLAAALPAVIVPSGAPNLLASYAATVDLPDQYQNAVLQYVLYRAFAKDSALPGSAARAVASYELFQSLLASIAGGEGEVSLTGYTTSRGGATS